MHYRSHLAYRASTPTIWQRTKTYVKKSFLRIILFLVVGNFLFSAGVNAFVVYSLFDIRSDYGCSKHDVREASESVVYLYGDEGSGSGFWVAPNVVLTNNHVVDYNPNMKLEAPDGEAHEVKVIATDTVRDLALLEVPNPPEYVEVIEFADTPPQLVEDVFAIGYPQDLNLTITEGVVSSVKRDDYDDRIYIQTDSAINPGNSGGPLVNMCGQVLGVNTYTLWDAQNIGFAITSDQVGKRVSEMLAAAQSASPEERVREYPSEEAEVVAKYYHTLYDGGLDKAYDFYSEARKQRLPYENWKKGFEKTVFITFKSVELTGRPNVVKVNFLTTERGENYQYITKEFGGEWSLVREGGVWKMDESNIKDLSQGI